MKDNNSATQPAIAPLSSGRSSIGRSGLGWGFVGVLSFSFTVPFTRVAAESGTLSPLFLGAGRAVVASVLAVAVLAVVRVISSPSNALATAPAPARIPTLGQCLRLLFLVAGGIVLGFPLLTSYALTQVPASHGAVVIALLPAVTAVAAILRTRERTTRSFWLMAGLSTVIALVFALVQAGGSSGFIGGSSRGLSGFTSADVLLFGAVLAAAIGYAEGGVLSRELGAWQTVCWALVLSLPITLVLTLASLRDGLPDASPIEWSAFAYLALVSMFLGYFAWYHGLAIGPMATVAQVQLTQPVMSIAWAALLLSERLDVPTVVCGAAVIGCAALTVRTRTAGVRKK